MAERRRAPRVSLRKYMVLYSKDSWLSFMMSKPGASAALVNVSKGGVQILTQEPLPAHSTFRVSIKSKQLVEPVSFKGLVAWCKKIAGKDFYQVGIRFAKPSTELAGEIDRLVEEHDFNAKMDGWQRGRAGKVKE
ncbi:MAG: PilZ domain-containing protein [Chloroflexi bacterium]|nr:PilZ domain-containing protein [Chloroflexota bacterium]